MHFEDWKCNKCWIFSENVHCQMFLKITVAWCKTFSKYYYSYWCWNTSIVPNIISVHIRIFAYFFCCTNNTKQVFGELCCLHLGTIFIRHVFRIYHKISVMIQHGIYFSHAVAQWIRVTFVAVFFESAIFKKSNGNFLKVRDNVYYFSYTFILSKCYKIQVWYKYSLRCLS